VPFTLAPGSAVGFIMSVWSTVLMLWILQVVTLRSVRELRYVEWAFILAAGLVVFSSVFQNNVVAQYGSYVARLDDNKAAMYDPNDLCVPLMMAVPLAVHMFQNTRRLGKVVCVVILIGIGWTIALSGSRGGFLGIVIVGLGLLRAAKGVALSKRLGVLFALALALIVAAPQGYWQQMGTIFAPEADYNWTSHDGRKAIWTRGLGYMAQYPIFGLGVSNFQTAECTINPLLKNADPDGDPVICAAPHNSFLQVGAELGIPGLAAWCTIVFGAMIAPGRLRRRLPSHWAQGDRDERFLFSFTLYLPLVSAGFACTAFFVSHAWMDTILYLAAITAAMYVAVERKLASQALPASPSVVSPVRVRRAAPMLPRGA
jgi:O-antigen ligase